MSLVTVKTKYQVTLPSEVREQINVQEGDIFEVTVQRGKIVLSPKTLIDKRLAEGLADIKAGRTHGPFNSVEEMLASLNK